MRIITFVAAGGIAVSGYAAAAKSPPTTEDLQLGRAEALIDAFYSFDAARLRTALADAPESRPPILYYQGWAEGGNYKVVDRRTCQVDKPGAISCSIKVKDDLIAALGTGYDVTDTFHIKFEDVRIVEVRTSSDDPPQVKQAFEWLVARDPELPKTGACKGFFAGGPTPGDCIRAVVKGFRAFAAQPRTAHDPR